MVQLFQISERIIQLLLIGLEAIAPRCRDVGGPEKVGLLFRSPSTSVRIVLKRFFASATLRFSASMRGFRRITTTAAHEHCGKADHRKRGSRHDVASIYLPLNTVTSPGLTLFRMKALKRLAFVLADLQEPVATLLLKFPAVEPCAQRLIPMEQTHFTAPSEQPEFGLEIEEVCRVLTFVHGRQIVFGQAEFVQRDGPPVEPPSHFEDIARNYFQADTFLTGTGR